MRLPMATPKTWRAKGLAGVCRIYRSVGCHPESCYPSSRDDAQLFFFCFNAVNVTETVMMRVCRDMEPFNDANITPIVPIINKPRFVIEKSASDPPSLPRVRNTLYLPKF